MSATLQPPEAACVSDAVDLAAHYARYALNHLAQEPRLLHPGVCGHLTASSCQLDATVTLLDPANDRKV